MQLRPKIKSVSKPNVIENVSADYDKEAIDEIEKSEIELKISDKSFSDFLLMKVRGKTISCASIKNKKAIEAENKLIEVKETLEKLEHKTENGIKQMQEKSGA